MPDEYIDPPIEFDEVALYQRGVTRIQSYFPNWTPKDGSMIDIILRSCGEMAAVTAEVASGVPSSVFRTFGTLAHLPPVDATPATVVATFVAQDANGYDIPVNTPVGLVVDGLTMDPVGFETLSDEVIPPGQTAINVTLIATIPGANTSSLNSVVRADSLGFITSITLVGSSSGGTDAELDPDYLNRLSSDFEGWTTTPIRGIEFGRKARDIQGVYRCAFWENFNPADGTTDNDKYVALCPIDVNGNDVSSAVQTQVQSYIEGLREVNFVAPVVGASRSPVDVTGVLHVPDVANQAQAIIDAQAALSAYLFPGTWGMPQTGSGQAPVWINTPIVRMSKIQTILETIANVDFSDGLEIGFSNPAPVAPMPTTNAAGGTVGAGTYEVGVTYTNADGETVMSVPTQITTFGGTSTITVPSPALPPVTAPAATGYRVYMTQAGGNVFTLQGATTAIGTDFTLTAPPTNTGSAPPATNSRLSTSDLTLPGAFPLPQTGTINITAVTP